jgi:hypothetical protein
MNIRALAIGAHEHYSPELHDKILDRMRMRSICVGFHLLTPTQLGALVEIESPEVPILSLYLQLSPERRASGAWRTAFNSLCAATLKPISDRRKWQPLNNEFERIAQALEDELPELASSKRCAQTVRYAAATPRNPSKMWRSWQLNRRWEKGRRWKWFAARRRDRCWRALGQ